MPEAKASATAPLIALQTMHQPVWTPRDYEAFAREGFMQNAIGSVMGPFDAYLTLRGAKTLAVRMRQHCASAAGSPQPRPRCGEPRAPAVPASERPATDARAR
jgi:hypothetical protein